MASGSKYAIIFNDGSVYPSDMEESEETLKNECEKSRLKMSELIDLLSKQNRSEIEEKGFPKGFFHLNNIEIVPMALLKRFICESSFFNRDSDLDLLFLFDDILEEHINFEVIDELFDISMTFSNFLNSFSKDSSYSKVVSLDTTVLVLGIKPEFKKESDYKMFNSLCQHVSVAYQGNCQILQIDDSLQKSLKYLENHFLQSNRANGVFIREHLAEMGRFFKRNIESTVYEEIILADELVVIGNFPLGLLILPEFEISLCEIKKIRYESTSYLPNLEARNFDCTFRAKLINRRSKIVILELLGTKDPIRDASDRAWYSFIQIIKTFGFQNVEKVNISSINKLEEYLCENSRDIQFLVISSHGNVDYSNGETYLVVGESNERWMPRHFEKFKFPPLVSISACFSGARSEEIKISVSDRILMNGADGVISTLFPINPKMNGLMHTKLLSHIAKAIDDGSFDSITEIWRKVSLITLIDSIALSTNKIQEIFFREGIYKKIESESKKGKIGFDRTLTDLKRIVSESTSRSIESFVVHDNYFSEALCYQLLGNTDIIFAGVKEAIEKKSLE